MTNYPDTSFLFAFYHQQTNSAAAAGFAARMREPLQIGELLKYEFSQALRFQTWRYATNPREGLSLRDAQAALQQFENDLHSGIAVLHSGSLLEILRLADQISLRHTGALGSRSFDILHVATALIYNAKQFLSFDSNQRRLAEAEGLHVKP